MNISERLKKFCEKYSIKILGDYKRVAIMPRAYSASRAQDIGSFEHYRSEPLLTVDIPLSKFEAIERLESIFFGNIDNIESRRVFEKWIEQQEEERRLRRQYPAVEKAYQEYTALLEWCGQANRKLTDIPSDNS